MAKSFRIELDALDYNLKNFDDRMRRAIQRSLEYQAARSETWMRTNAPWTDRTTNARNGLFAMVYPLFTNSWLLILSHSVHYGIYLEVSNSGRYAVVRPAWLRANKQTMNLLSRAFTRMEKGRK